MPELAARAYDTAAWRFGWQKRNLNFPEVQSQQEAEFLAPEVREAPHEEEKEHRRTIRQLEAHDFDEVAMSRYRQEHPDEVQTGYKFFAARDAAPTEKKIKEKKEDELKETM
jgi:hypothetical protein